METIIIDFNYSTERLLNNFYLSFLAINFLNQRPLNQDVKIPVDWLKNIITSESLDNFKITDVNEYGNSIRRHFLNDLVIIYETYASSMFLSHSNNKNKVQPATIYSRKGADSFENLEWIINSEQKKFLTQLRRLRNSIVHYNWKYCITNKLDYTFWDNTYFSEWNEWDDITISFDSLLSIYYKIIEIVCESNKNYFENL